MQSQKNRFSEYVVSTALAFGGVFGTDMLTALPAAPSWPQVVALFASVCMVIFIALRKKKERTERKQLFSRGLTWLLASIASTSLANGVHVVEAHGFGILSDILFFIFVLIPVAAYVVKSEIDGGTALPANGSVSSVS